MGKQTANNDKAKRSTLSTKQKQLKECLDKLLRISTIPQQPNVLKALENQKEISSILEKVNKLELSKNSSQEDADRSPAKVDKFIKWVKENDGVFEGCVISQFEGYDLGIKTCAKVPVDSLVIAIPRKLMLTSENAHKSILKDMLENDQVLKNMPNVALAIYLLLEKNKQDSFYKPYLDLLPKTYTTVLYFSVEELEELKGSPTLDVALKQIKSIARQYAYFQTIFSTSNDPVSKILEGRFTFEEYRWAVSTVMTRQNAIPSEDGSFMSTALIPLWDMCNHTNGKISTDYNPQLDRSECLALKNFEVGEQLFIFYGARSNADLFIHNGFVYEDNEHDSYCIKMGVSKSDSLQEKRLNLLNKLGLSSLNDFYISKEGKTNGKLLAFLRIFNMNENHLDHWLKSEKTSDLEYLECALDTDLEKKSWLFFDARLKLILATYKTTLMEDTNLIKNNKLTPNKLLALRMRAIEKTIITETLEHVQQFIKQ